MTLNTTGIISLERLKTSNLKIYIGFQVLTAVFKKSTVFWDTTNCMLPASFGFLHDLFFEAKNGGDIFLRNVG
jgi:hypothetical protein